MLWVGILPALLCLFIRTYVRESEVWEENNRKRLEQKLLAPPSAAAGRGALAGTVIGWVVGAVAVAVTIFGALKVAAPAVLTPKLMSLLLDDKLLGVVAAGLTPFVLPNLAALVGVAIPTQLAIFRPPFLWNTFTASIWMTGQFLVYSP